MYVACLFPYRGICSSVGSPRHLVMLYNTTSWRWSGQSGKKCLLLGTFSWAAQSLHIATSSALHQDTRPLRANAFHTPRSQLLLCYPHQPWRLLGFAVERFSLKAAVLLTHLSLTLIRGSAAFHSLCLWALAGWEMTWSVGCSWQVIVWRKQDLLPRFRPKKMSVTSWSE